LNRHVSGNIDDNLFFSQLDLFEGLAQAKKTLRSIYFATTKSREIARHAPKMVKAKEHIDNMIFTGPPGTGKTSFAVVVQAMLATLREAKGLRSVPFKTFVRGDLVGEHLGETSQKVKAAFAKCRKGVFFLDEAYQLTTDDYGREALDTIMTLCEDPETVFILATYPDKIDTILSTNDGLRRRFPTIITFEPLSSGELALAVHRTLKNKQVMRDRYSRLQHVASPSDSDLKDIIESDIPARVRAERNGQVVGTLLRNALEHQMDRAHRCPESQMAAILKTLTVEDFRQGARNMAD
jgi:replication-associated recombination protein RarA